MRLIDYPRRHKRGVRRWLPSWKLVLGTSATFAVLLVAGFLVALSQTEIPKPNGDAVQQATIFTYADASTQITHIGTNRRPVTFDQTPLVVRQAVLAAEDRTFYSDPGVSPMGLLRALKNDLSSSGGNLQGGSTITQQFVKNYYLTQQQTLSRKLNEVMVAIKLDQVKSKDSILTDYLNTIYFARGAYGIESASLAYFGVGVSQLTDPAKAAYIAAVIQSPYYYATADKDPKAAKALQDRWNYVLDGMVGEHELSAQQRATLTFPTAVRYEPDDMGGMNGYMVDAAMQNLDRMHAQDPTVPDSTTVAQGGFTVVTTFRQDYMQAAKKAVDDRMSTLDPDHRPQDRNVHIGMASVDDKTGAVLGFYGGPDYLKQGFNDAFSAAGPLGDDVEKALGSAVPGNHYQDAGIDYIPGTKALATTPLRAASAMSSMDNGYQYNQPFEVSEIMQNGVVVWRAQPQTQNFWGTDDTIAPVRQVTPFKSWLRGADVPKWWAWSMLDYNGVTTAANMFATPPDGKGNRALLGMTGGYEANLDQALFNYVGAIRK